MKNIPRNCLNFLGLNLLGMSLLFFGGALYGQATLTNAPSDSQIARILETVNTSEINVSRVAENSSNKAVRKFAKNMVKAHSDNNTQADRLMKRLGVPVEDSQTSEDMKIDATKKLEALKQLQGPAFDKAYIDSLVSAHESALSEMNETLIPNAKDPKLISFLKETRNVVEEHLNHAKEIQTALAK